MAMAPLRKGREEASTLLGRSWAGRVELKASCAAGPLPSVGLQFGGGTAAGQVAWGKGLQHSADRTQGPETLCHRPSSPQAGWRSKAGEPTGPGPRRPPPTRVTRHAHPPPPPTRALTVLLSQGQVRCREGQKALAPHVTVQQPRDLAMEAGPEVEVCEFQVHLRGQEREPARGGRLGETEAHATALSHSLKYPGSD